MVLVMRSELEPAAAFAGLVAGLPREGSSEAALIRVRFAMRWSIHGERNVEEDLGILPPPPGGAKTQGHLRSRASGSYLVLVARPSLCLGAGMDGVSAKPLSYDCDSQFQLRIGWN